MAKGHAASSSWLASRPCRAARLRARLRESLLGEFGTPEGVIHASGTALEACNLPATAAQALFKKQPFWRVEPGVDAFRRMACPGGEWYGVGIPVIARAGLRSTGSSLDAGRPEPFEPAEPGPSGQ